MVSRTPARNPFLGAPSVPAAGGAGLQYRPLSPGRSALGGGLSGLGALLMALGSGQPQQAAAAFQVGLQGFDEQQDRRASQAQQNELFGLEMQDRYDARQADADAKAAAAAEKADRDAAIEVLVKSGRMDPALADALRAGVIDYGDTVTKKAAPINIGGKLYDPDDPTKLIADHSQDEIAVKLAGRDVTTISNNIGGDNAADAKLRSKLSEKEGERWSGLKEAGVISAGLGQDFEIIDQLLTVAPQGPIQGNLAAAFPGFSSAGDAFQSVVTRVAPSLRTPGSGATSDIEYEGMLKSLPRLGNSPDGNKIIAGVMKAKAALNVERSQVVTAYENEQITAKEARSRLAEIDKRSIMTPELRKTLGVVGIVDPSATADESAPTATGPNGEKLILRNGQWGPM